VFDYNREEKLASDKHSSLLGLYISYEEKKILWIWPHWPLGAF